jgi:hypothetical protein
MKQEGYPSVDSVSLKYFKLLTQCTLALRAGSLRLSFELRDFLLISRRM